MCNTHSPLPVFMKRVIARVQPNATTKCFLVFLLVEMPFLPDQLFSPSRSISSALPFLFIQVCAMLG